jgi:hypothetical protein
MRGRRSGGMLRGSGGRLRKAGWARGMGGERPWPAGYPGCTGQTAVKQHLSNCVVKCAVKLLSDKPNRDPHRAPPRPATPRAPRPASRPQCTCAAHRRRPAPTGLTPAARPHGRTCPDRPPPPTPHPPALGRGGPTRPFLTPRLPLSRPTSRARSRELHFRAGPSPLRSAAGRVGLQAGPTAGCGAAEAEGLACRRLALGSLRLPARIEARLSARAEPRDEPESGPGAEPEPRGREPRAARHG